MRASSNSCVSGWLAGDNEIPVRKRRAMRSDLGLCFSPGDDPRTMSALPSRGHWEHTPAAAVRLLMKSGWPGETGSTGGCHGTDSTHALRQPGCGGSGKGPVVESCWVHPCSALQCTYL